ncbi:MAG: PAS domain S-box protein [Pseudomonadota bacterium]
MDKGDTKTIPVTGAPVQPRVQSAGLRASAALPLRVLIIADESQARTSVRLALESQGFLLSEADNGTRGRAAAAALLPDCILLDSALPDIDWRMMLDVLRRPDGALPCAVVMLTSGSDGVPAAGLLQAGALDYLDKGCLTEDSLRRAVDGAVHRHRLEDERRQAEEHNAQLAAIVSSTTDGIFSVGRDRLVRTWNPGAAALFGYTQSEAVGCVVDDLIVPAYKQEEMEQLRASVFERKEPVCLETERRHKDGRLIPVEVSSAPVFDQGGEVTAVSLVVRDRTDRVQVRKDLHTRNERLAQIARASSRLVLESGQGATGARTVLTELAAALGYELFFQYDADEPGRRLRLAASNGLTPTQHDAFAQISFGQYLCGLVAERREPMVMERFDVGAFPQAAELDLEDVKLYASFPLLVQGEMLGTAAFATRERDRLDEGELQHIQTLCTLAAAQLWRARADAALQTSQARLALFVEHAPAAIAMLDRDMRYVAASRRYALDYDLPADAPLAGRSHYDVFPDLPQHWPALHARVMGGEAFSRDEDRFIRADGRVDWLSWAMTPWRTADGEVGGMLMFSELRTRQVEARRALAESEARLDLALHASGTGVWDYDLTSGNVTWSGHIHPIFGVEEFGGTTEEFFAFVHPDDRGRLEATVATALPVGTMMAEFRIVRPGGAVRWVETHAVVLPDASGQPARLLGTVTDITERKQHEEHTQLLMQEVNHRAKNMLALIQAVARLTRTTDPDEFVERFSQRVRAIAANQDLLVKSNWKTVPLDQLIRSQLAHFGDRGDTRAVLDGPPVAMTAAASQTFGMAFHELATNAAKYGALSTSAGQVAVRWDVRQQEDGTARLVVSWVERGGPTVGQPSHRGFGSTVISSMIKRSLGCEVSIDFAPEGVVWRVDCAADRVLEGYSAAAAGEPAGAAKPPRRAGAGGRRVLVVEDEALVALEIDEALSAGGIEVLGPAGSVSEALSLLAEGRCDIALLDINLGAETSEPVARELKRLGIPFIVVSGYSREQQPEAMRSAPLLSKPLDAGQLLAAIERCCNERQQ